MTDVANPATGVVTVWSDITCPWATVSMHMLHAAAVDAGREVVVDHRAFPLELFNRMPTPKGIIDAEIVTIAGHLPELGWQPWSGPDWTYPVTVLPSMEAVQAAKRPEVGGLLASDQLDSALRSAFFADSRCISIHSVILDVAASCSRVDVDALADALARGIGRAEVYQDWRVAGGGKVQGSPHVFTANGYSAHNPGARYHWTGKPPAGLPRLDAYDRAWAADLRDRLAG